MWNLKKRVIDERKEKSNGKKEISVEERRRNFRMLKEKKSISLTKEIKMRKMEKAKMKNIREKKKCV